MPAALPWLMAAYARSGKTALKSAFRAGRPKGMPASDCLEDPSRLELGCTRSCLGNQVAPEKSLLRPPCCC